ncbi:Serine/threonine protein kinase [Parasponia andersonii]|uniref:Serine/threonine protein kinase n=1 Tax=Parasponia andersonii TaxID=3476 RepID=A0A2P5DR45_PARAD|nr:Serine/threonine protein kinase [Parasponia andersonii]
MGWVRGENVGRGSFATISIATYVSDHHSNDHNQLLPPLLAVKSSELCSSDSLKNEKQVLDAIGSSTPSYYCPHIIRCFGEEQTVEKGQKFHNLLLEFASGGSLTDQLKKYGGRLPEPDVRRYTTEILKGISVVHSKGFVHCDLKLENILLFDDGVAKIADFGLAKETGPIKKPGGQTGMRCEIRGTPLYMAPESVNANEYEPPCDIWALGCVVAEMVTGKPAWDHKPGSNIWKLLMRIAGDDELPEIPEELSDDGKDFLSKCFVKDPRKRWTAEMLLNHPFVVADHLVGDSVSHEEVNVVVATILLEDDGKTAANKLSVLSPRCPLDFIRNWASTTTTSTAPSTTCVMPSISRRSTLVGNEMITLNCSLS